MGSPWRCITCPGMWGRVPLDAFGQRPTPQMGQWYWAVGYPLPHQMWWGAPFKLRRWDSLHLRPAGPGKGVLPS